MCWKVTWVMQASMLESRTPLRDRPSPCSQRMLSNPAFSSRGRVSISPETSMHTTSRARVASTRVSRPMPQPMSRGRRPWGGPPRPPPSGSGRLLAHPPSQKRAGSRRSCATGSRGGAACSRTPTRGKGGSGDPPVAGGPLAAVVSLIVPNRNNEPVLDLFLEKLAAHTTHPDFELIFVDDGSTDRSVEVLERWRASGRIERFTLLRKPATGIVDTLNLALAHAEGELVVRLDGDATLESPGWLERMLALHASDERVGIVTGRTVFEDGRVHSYGLNLVGPEGVHDRGTRITEPVGERTLDVNVERPRSGAGAGRRGAGRGGRAGRQPPYWERKWGWARSTATWTACSPAGAARRSPGPTTPSAAGWERRSWPRFPPRPGGNPVQEDEGSEGSAHRHGCRRRDGSHRGARTRDHPARRLLGALPGLRRHADLLGRGAELRRVQARRRRHAPPARHRHAAPADRDAARVRQQQA